MNIIELIKFAKDQNASDLHLSSGEPPRLRQYGEMLKLEAPPLSVEETLAMINSTMTPQQQKDFQLQKDLDFSYEVPNLARLRVNAFFHNDGVGACYRIIPERIIPFAELGLPESVKKITKMEKGLVLVTGPGGCGKSTTLATLIDLLNQTRNSHILTIEDPVEFIHTPSQCIINHRQVGSNTKSFAKALKSALREDPDIILIGELRDLETISLALTAAETGHLVLGTLHTSSAAKTVTRIIDVFPASKKDQIRTMLAESLQMVISQILLKNSKQPGRIAAFEVLMGTIGVRSLVRENKIFQITSAIETGIMDGMQSMDMALAALVQAGSVDINEALRYTADKDQFQSMLQGSSAEEAYY